MDEQAPRTPQDLIALWQELEIPQQQTPTPLQLARQYTSFSGVDISDLFEPSLHSQTMSYPIQRRLHKMPEPDKMIDPLSFSRGKRGIAGTIISLMLDENAGGTHPPYQKEYMHKTTPLTAEQKTIPLYDVEEAWESDQHTSLNPDAVCHCGIERSRHAWEEHSFVELEQPQPRSPKSKCDVCDEMFPTAGELRIHRQDKHGWIRGRQPPKA